MLINNDVDLIEIGVDGLVKPSISCVGHKKLQRVERSVELYGLNLGNLVTARKRIIREVTEQHQNFMEIVSTGTDMLAIERIKNQIRRTTLPDSPYSLAARCTLNQLPSGSYFCAKPEDTLQI